jgi:sulfide:quinone oxidoreductase
MDGRDATTHRDGDGSSPRTTQRGKIVLPGFGCGGAVKPSFPKWRIGGTIPSRSAWLVRERLCWRAMRGREWLDRSRRVEVLSDPVSTGQN